MKIGDFQTALDTGDSAQVLASLVAGQAPAGSTPNPLRTELVLSSALAAQLGITGEHEGDNIVARWADVTEAQFTKLVDLFQQNPALIEQSIRGAGDVSYLKQDAAHALADQLGQGAKSLLTAFAAMETVRDKIRTLAVGLSAAGAKILPPDLADRFAHGIVDPIRDRMLAVLTSGLPVAEMQKQLDALGTELEQWVGLVALYGTVTQDIAALSGDLVTQTQGAILGVQGLLGAADKAVTDAQARATAAVGPEAVLAAEVALREAILKRYATEIELVQRIEATIKGLLDQAATLVQMVTAIAQYDITSSGSFGTITALLASLQGVAEHGSTAAAQLWAVDQGLKAIIATLPTAIAKFGSMQHKEDWLASGQQTAGQLQAGGPNQISRAVVTAAAPFLAVQQGAIDKSSGGAKLGLLQQQAQAWDALATAAIAGVNQWAQQAIAGAQDAAAAVHEGLATTKDATVDRLNAQKTTALAAIDAQIKGIQDAAQAEQDYRAAQMEALQQAIAKAEEFASAIESMGKFIAGLKQGPLGPGNPADKLALAQQSFAKALLAFNAAPTATGLTDLQGLAQTMLSLAEPIFSKPSPQFQALSATTIKQLTAAQALAAGQATDSDVLKAQLAALQAANKAASQGVADQIAALNDQKAARSDKFDAQIKVVNDGFDADVKAINAALKDQITAINKAAQDEIAGISRGPRDGPEGQRRPAGPPHRRRARRAGRDPRGSDGRARGRGIHRCALERHGRPPHRHPRRPQPRDPRGERPRARDRRPVPPPRRRNGPPQDRRGPHPLGGRGRRHARLHGRGGDGHRRQVGHADARRAAGVCRGLQRGRPRHASGGGEHDQLLEHCGRSHAHRGRRGRSGHEPDHRAKPDVGRAGPHL
jgi:hypothetical protein